MQNSIPSRSGLHDHTGYWLNRLRGLVDGSFERRLAEYDVTVAQWSALIVVYRGDATAPNEIARFIGIDSGAMTRLLDRMVEKRLIARRPAGRDRRAVTIELTDHGRILAPVLAGIADANDEEFFGALSPAEHVEFRRLLAKLLGSRGAAVPESWLGGGQASSNDV